MENATGPEGRICRRCLLEELGETAYLQSVHKYYNGLPPREKTPEDEYAARLESCKNCEQLADATCGLCGCYVEMRAARKTSHCPASPARW